MHDCGRGYSWEQLEPDAQPCWQSSYEDYKYAGTSCYLQPAVVGQFPTMKAGVGYRLTERVARFCCR